MTADPGKKIKVHLKTLALALHGTRDVVLTKNSRQKLCNRAMYLRTWILVSCEKRDTCLKEINEWTTDCSGVTEAITKPVFCICCNSHNGHAYPSHKHVLELATGSCQNSCLPHGRITQPGLKFLLTPVIPFVPAEILRTVSAAVSQVHVSPSCEDTCIPNQPPSAFSSILRGLPIPETTSCHHFSDYRRLRTV